MTYKKGDTVWREAIEPTYRIEAVLNGGVKWYKLYRAFFSSYFGNMEFEVEYYPTKEEAEAEKARRLSPHVCEASGYECKKAGAE